MLFNTVKKSKSFFSNVANAHRTKPEIQFDQLKSFSKLNNYFKKHKEVYKNKAKLICNEAELLEAKIMLFKKYSAHGLIDGESPFQEKAPDYFLANTKVFSLKSKNNLLSAAKVYFEENVTIRASDLVNFDIRELRARGFKLAEMTPIVVSDDYIKDKNFYPEKNNLYTATLLKTFSGIINYVYQFSNVTHLVVLASNSEKSFYEWLGFKEFSNSVRAKNFPYAELSPLVLDIKEMLSSADKNIAAYLILINMEVLKKGDDIFYTESEIIDYFEQYPSAVNFLNQLEKECLIKQFPQLRDIFYTKKIRIKHSASYRKETTQFTLNSFDLKEVIKLQ